MTDPKQVVRDGYDAIADEYGAWAASFDSPVGSWVTRFLELVPPRSRLLDLGCGNGSIVARRLVDAGHEVVGADISRAQLERAARNVPEMSLVHGDAAELSFDSEFDGIVCTFVFGHVPRAEQGPLLARIRGWLKPGGVLLVTLGVGGSEDVVVDGEWFGVPMFFASWDPETNLRLLAEAGLSVVEGRVVPWDEPGHGRVRFMWVLATRPSIGSRADGS